MISRAKDVMNENNNKQLGYKVWLDELLRASMKNGVKSIGINKRYLTVKYLNNLRIPAKTGF